MRVNRWKFKEKIKKNIYFGKNKILITFFKLKASGKIFLYNQEALNILKNKHRFCKKKKFLKLHKYRTTKRKES